MYEWYKTCFVNLCDDWNIIQIMNVYECYGKNIFMRWKIECFIQWGKAELNGTFNFSLNENILSIARIKNIHYLFYTTSKEIIVIWYSYTENCVRLIKHTKWFNTEFGATNTKSWSWCFGSVQMPRSHGQSPIVRPKKKRVVLPSSDRP